MEAGCAGGVGIERKETGDNWFAGAWYLTLLLNTRSSATVASSHQITSNSPIRCPCHSPLYGRKKIVENKTEWPGKAQFTKASFLATGEAYTAIFSPTLCFKRKNLLISLGSRQRGGLTSAFAVPHLGEHLESVEEIVTACAKVSPIPQNFVDMLWVCKTSNRFSV